MPQLSKSVTSVDVARAANVSTATVSRVFGGKTEVVLPSTADRVRAVAQALGYTPSEIGRSLRLSSSRIVVMVVPDATNDFCADVAVSVERAIAGRGLSMVLMNTGEDAARQDALLGDAISLRPRAIVLLGAIDTPALRRLADKQRLVFVNRRPPAAIGAPFVGIDDEAAGAAVAARFLAAGHTRYAAIHGPTKYSASRSRLRGFRKRLIEAGIADSDITSVESQLTMEAGYERGGDLCRSHARPTAVFCGNDMIAYGIHRAAMEAGLDVPRDISICGFDDNRINDWLAPWLTSVRVPALQIGPAVAGLLASVGKAQPEDVILPFTLMVRRSA